MSVGYFIAIAVLIYCIVFQTGSPQTTMAMALFCIMGAIQSVTRAIKDNNTSKGEE